jgi:hypothetical protein
MKKINIITIFTLMLGFTSSLFAATETDRLINPCNGSQYDIPAKARACGPFTLATLSDITPCGVSGSGTGGNISIWTGCGASTALGDSNLSQPACDVVITGGNHLIGTNNRGYFMEDNQQGMIRFGANNWGFIYNGTAQMQFLSNVTRFSGGKQVQFWNTAEDGQVTFMPSSIAACAAHVVTFAEVSGTMAIANCLSVNTLPLGTATSGELINSNLTQTSGNINIGGGSFFLSDDNEGIFFESIAEGFVNTACSANNWYIKHNGATQIEFDCGITHFATGKAIEFHNVAENGSVTLTPASISACASHSVAWPETSGDILVSDVATISDAANLAWDMANGTQAQVTVTASRIVDNPTNINKGPVSYRFTHSGGGFDPSAWGTAYEFAGGTKPVLGSGGAGSVDMVFFHSNGTLLYHIGSTLDAQ